MASYEWNHVQRKYFELLIIYFYSPDKVKAILEADFSKWDVWWCLYPGTQNVEVRESGFQVCPGLHSELEASLGDMRSCPKNF